MLDTISLAPHPQNTCHQHMKCSTYYSYCSVRCGLSLS